MKKETINEQELANLIMMSMTSWYVRHYMKEKTFATIEEFKTAAYKLYSLYSVSDEVFEHALQILQDIVDADIDGYVAYEQ